MEDIIVFQSLKVFNSQNFYGRNVQVTFVAKLELKKAVVLKTIKHTFLVQT